MAVLRSCTSRKKRFLAVFFLLSLVSALPAFELIPHSGAGIRISSFGIPNELIDLLIYEHPTISGHAFALEYRSYGEKGPKSVFSGLYCLEYSKMSGTGYWRVEQYNKKLDSTGEISQISLTATIIMNLFPSLPVHPYIGAGIGISAASIFTEGVYTDELGTEIRDSYKANKVLPVGHIPVGLMINIASKIEIRIEGGFKNGFYFGGAVAYNFNF